VESGAQPGNRNATKGADWRDAIRYELAAIGRDVEGDDPAYRKGLRKCAAKFIEAACDGNLLALKELGDRMDGKAPQAIELGGPDGGPIPAVAWSILPVTPIDKADEQA